MHATEPDAAPPSALGRRVAGATARALPPAALAAVLWVRGRRRAVLVLAVVAVLLLVAGVVAPRAMARLDAGLRLIGDRVSRGLSLIAASLVWALVVLPLWAMSRVVRYSPLDLGWATATSAWLRVDDGRLRRPDGRPLAPQRLGFQEPVPTPAVRRRRRLRLLPIVVAIAVVGLAAVRSAVTDRDGIAAPTSIALGAATAPSAGPVTEVPDIPDDELIWAGLPVDSYAHEDEPWAPDLFRELLAPYYADDYTLGAQYLDFTGRYLNIVDGHRVTREPAKPQGTVWFFGGSTTFGIGQRDAHTIPSEVSRLAEQAGHPVEIVNYGVSGDVNWHETIRLAEALESGAERPDLIVFYDGCNEMANAWQRVDDGSLDPAKTERFLVDEDQRDKHKNTLPEVTRPEGDALGTTVSTLGGAQYGRGVAFGRRLADGYGIPIVHVWQPMPYAKVASPADAELYRRTGFDQANLPWVSNVYAQMLERSDADPIDLSTALDRTTEPVYFDGCHTNERGARIIAQQLFDAIEPQLPG